jgi:hypothetical protein
MKRSEAKAFNPVNPASTAVPASVRYSTIPEILDTRQSQIRNRTSLDWETLYTQVFCNKEDGIGPLNLAVYWKRRYRGKGPKEPWYILTNLPQLPLALSLYRARWGIEQMFKDTAFLSLVRYNSSNL